MPLLTVPQIKLARQQKLAALATPQTTVVVSHSHGLPPQSVTTVAPPKPKKIFSILSWNIQDYKGSKIVSEDSSKINAFVNHFIKVLNEELKVDLLMLIETYIDLTEAVAEIEGSSSTGFGSYSYGGMPVSTSTGSLKDPYDDLKAVHDDTFYALVKKRVEALSAGTLNYVPIGSPPTFKRVQMPASFTANDFQKTSVLKVNPSEWAPALEEFSHCYDAYYKKSPIAYDVLMTNVAKLSKKQLQSDAKNIEFRLRTSCADCAGAGKVSTPYDCLLCGGSKVAGGTGCLKCSGRGQMLVSGPCSGCGGAKTVPGPCGNCGGAGRRTVAAPCGNCGGKGCSPPLGCDDCGRTGRVVARRLCNSCGGSGRRGMGICIPCAANGFIEMYTACGNCGGNGVVTLRCLPCKGSGTIQTEQVCGNCGGGGSVPVPCGTCRGAGQEPTIATCDRCRGFGIEPQYLCTGCNGLGGVRTTTACGPCGGTGAVFTAPCQACRATGFQHDKCLACDGSGRTDEFWCLACDGSGKRDRCNQCAGTGKFDPDAECNVRAALADMVSRKTFDQVDIETYTLLWRDSQLKVQSSFIAARMPAAGEKAAWVNPAAAELRSTDDQGTELGYQTIGGIFNSRVPFVIPLYFEFDGAEHFVPVVLFHAIWGASSGAVVTGRIDSVLKIPQLAARDENTLVAIGKATNSMIVGDLNLQYKPTTKTNEFTVAINKLQTQGYQPLVGGTRSGIGAPKSVSKLTQKKKGDIYTYAYDQFLVKGTQLNANVVSCGVVDVLGYLETTIASDSNLRAWLDKDNGSSLQNDKARAFYLYRNYISDHLPVIFDFVVDETSPEHKKLVSQEVKRSLDEVAFLNGPRPPLIVEHSGTWQTVTAATTQAYALRAEGKNVALTGRVYKLTHPDRIGVELVPDSAPVIRFEGPFVPGGFKGNLGDWISATIITGAVDPVAGKVTAGYWKALRVPTAKKWVFRGEGRNAAITGRIFSIEMPDIIRVAIPYTDCRRVFEGRIPGPLTGGVADLGAWREGDFTLDPPTG